MDLDSNIVIQNIIKIEGQYSFHEGQLFDSYEEILERMKNHSKESLVFYWRRDSRTVEKAFTKTSRPLDSRLKYYSVRFACVYGGENFKSRSTGKKAMPTPTKRAFNCQANIFFRASKCGKKLEVISVCNLHNHEVSAKASELLPQNRRLSPQVKDEVCELLKMKVNRIKIALYVKEKENKDIKSKDLFNFSSRLKGIGCKIKFSDDRLTVLKRIIAFTTDEIIKETVTKEILKYNEYAINDALLTDYIEIDLPSNIISVDYETSSSKIIPSIKNDQEIIEDLNSNNIETSTVETSFTNTEIDSEGCLQTNNLFENFNEDQNNPLIIFEEYEDRQLKDEAYESDKMLVGNEIVENKLNAYSVEYCMSPEKNYKTFLGNINNDEILFEASDNIKGAHESNHTVVKKQDRLKEVLKKSHKKIVRCRKCGTSTKLVKMQIDYLRTQRNRMREQIKMLKTKRRTLELEVDKLELRF